MYATPCSEFPNDNPVLHSGAILAVEDVCGPPVVRMIGVDLDAGWAALGREIADGEVREEPALSRPSGIYLSGEMADVECDDIVITPLEPLAEAEIFGEEVPVEEAEVAEEACAFADLVEIMAGAAEHEEAGAGSWVRTLVGEGLAPALAHDRVTSLVAGGILLADGSVAPKFDGARRGWRAILRNESEDFGPCGALALDEWAADAIARLLGSASRAAVVKRRLRDHGVAAFGLSLRAA